MVFSGNIERLFPVDAEILNGRVDILVAEEELGRTQVARLTVDVGRLSSSQAMPGVAPRVHPRSGDPLFYEAAKLLNAEGLVRVALDGREQEIRTVLVGSGDPTPERVPRLFGHREGDHLPGLALPKMRGVPHSLFRAGHVTNLEPYQIAPAKLAIERDIEQCQIAERGLVVLLGKHEPDEVDLIGRERRRLTDDPPLVPWDDCGHDPWLTTVGFNDHAP